MYMHANGAIPAYEDVASKFFEHFTAIADAINHLGGTGLWDDQDGFYYDEIHMDGREIPLKTRSLVGLIPLIAVEVLDEHVLDGLPEFRKRMDWFLKHRTDLAERVSCIEPLDAHQADHRRRLLALPSRDRLTRMLAYMLDETEFLSPFGIRSLSKVHERAPYVFRCGGEEFHVRYDPGESTTGLFGGNSNWRGPVWLPLNFLIIEALERYHYVYGDTLRVDFPTGSGNPRSLKQVADELSDRLVRLFVPGSDGRRLCHGDDRCYVDDAHWRDLVLFHEYFHGESGRGCGAGHQTGWTALVTLLMEKAAKRNARSAMKTTHPSHGH